MADSNTSSTSRATSGLLKQLDEQAKKPSTQLIPKKYFNATLRLV